MLWSHSPFSPLKGGCDITRARPHSPLYPLYSVCLVCVCVLVQCGQVLGDNDSLAPIYVQQWDVVVLDRHLVLLVLAALGICVGYMCGCGA